MRMLLGLRRNAAEVPRCGWHHLAPCGVRCTSFRLRGRLVTSASLLVTSAVLVITSATLVITSATLVVTSAVLVVTSATLVVTSALLLVTMFASSIYEPTNGAIGRYEGRGSWHRYERNKKARSRTPGLITGSKDVYIGTFHRLNMFALRPKTQGPESARGKWLGISARQCPPALVCELQNDS